MALAGCGGSSGGGGGDTPELGPNDAPQIQVPAQLSGGPVQFTYVLPVTGSQSLRFAATDPDGDVLTWQVAVSASGATAAGLTFASPASGSNFSIELSAIAAPVAANLSVLVEDPRGAAAAIDIQLIRSGAPTISALSRSSAFASAPQDLTIQGSAFSLGGTVTTTPSFSGVVANSFTIVNDSTLNCTTPAAAMLGVNTVAVSNQYGNAQAPANSFTMYSYPVDLLENDVAFDSGGGSQLVTANDGGRMHAVWLEGAAVQYSRSLDAGATWSPAAPISGAETPASPKIVVDADTVAVVWLGDVGGSGGSLQVSVSTDAGETFTTTRELAAANASTPDLAVSGKYIHCVWTNQPPGPVQQVYTASSTNFGVNWGEGRPAYTTSENQTRPVVGCYEGDAWIALRQGVDQRVYTSHSSNAGFIWKQGVARSNAVGAPDTAAVLLCNDGPRVYLVWADDGSLFYKVSENAGLGWSTQQSLLRSSLDLGNISAVDASVDCEQDRLAVCYFAGNATVAFTRIGAAGALPEHVTLNSIVEAVRQTQVALRGNYVFAAWSAGDIASARIKLSTSTNRGVSFTSDATFGDGSAAQVMPSMMVDSARLWLGWLDSRNAPALFSTRTER